MWLFLKDSFLSIVQDPKDSEKLLVRARVKGDIEKVFPDFKVQKTPKRDYLYRASIPREMVEDAMVTQVKGIVYDNYKDEVKKRDKIRVGPYTRVWFEMQQMQLDRSKGKKPWLKP